MVGLGLPRLCRARTNDVLVAAVAPKPRGLEGGYGFLSSASFGPQPETEIRARVAVMARKFGIRDFQFYDWFADYSTPVRGAHWTDPYFRRSTISRQTIAIAIDEVHRQGARAWAYIQSVGAEEIDLENSDRGIFKLRNAKGEWHWHPPGSPHPRFPTYFANAAWAEHMVTRWAGPVKELGFDGIHWDTLGRIAGNYAEETKGIHAFVQAAHPLLASHGLRQTLNFVDLAWWDRALVRSYLEFPYAETWSDATARRYFAEMDKRDMAGIRGAFAMYATVAVPANWTTTEVIRARHSEAAKHHLAYLVVGDGPRRMKSEYWPDTVPLTEEEIAFLRTNGK